MNPSQVIASSSARHQFSWLILVAFVFTAATLRAQLGDDNPSGPSGVFNGDVTTAGSYDPYTGNAARSVTDIVVAGSVGAYPLAFTRTMNTRVSPYGGGTFEFGQAGGWRHSYQWSIHSMSVLKQPWASDRWTVMPSNYTVSYPDGRIVGFNPSSQDSNFHGPPGVSDRFQPGTDPNGGNCYLLLPDGGKVWFWLNIDRELDNQDQGTVTSTFTFSLVGIIDPYGQVTTVTYPGDGSLTITEPAGRTLKLFYVTTPWNGDTVVDSVVASDGRSVKYNYGGYNTQNGSVYTYLGNIVYFGDSSNLAIYSYQDSNIDPNGRPLLQWAIDPMYAGPMWAIGYTYVQGSSVLAYGQLQSENFLDPTNGNMGAPVSSLSINGDSRTETRGDGPSRTFNYSNAQLVNYTDFKGQTSYIGYDGNGFTSTLTNARGYPTSTAREPRIGALSSVTHPGDNSTASFGYTDANNPYYLNYRTDERGNPTSLTRNGNNQVERIDYPNGAYETFAYNNFGQVYSHRMTSGGIETKYIDGRGIMWASNDPDGTTYYYYDGNDRLEHVTDALSNTTWFQYNALGQVTRITHMDGSYVQYGYDNHGDRTSVTDELGHTTTYVYDDYKRVVSVINPLAKTTTINYALDWSHPYLHTTSNPNYVLTPMSKNVVYGYDENLRKSYQIVAAGTADDAWTWFGYDPAGNLTNLQDPKGNVKTFGYDNRNRRISATAPYPFDNQVTRWEYDPTNNLTKETRPDLQYRQWAYDSMNRVTDMYGFDYVHTNEHIHWDRNSTDTVESMTDAKNKVYTFQFDELHRKVSAGYPLDANNEQRSESWLYDEGGNLRQHVNRAGATQTFDPYDNRNRPTSFTWSDGTQGVSFNFDNASRLIGLHNSDADIAFGYDDANHETSETETIKAFGLNQAHTVTYDYDDDGNRSRLFYPQGLDYRYAYTNRNQVQNIRLAWLSSPTVQYTYDPNGNRATRANYSGAYTSYDFNELNLLRSQMSYFANGRTARFDYGYDANNRIKYEQRDSGLTDGFGYDARNEITSYQQDGTLNTGDGSVSAPYNLTISYDANGNRIDANEVVDIAHYASADSNQYTSDWTGGIGYDHNGNLISRAGWSYGYDAQNRLKTIDSNDAGVHIEQRYDGLNRMVARKVGTDITTNVWDHWDLIEEHFSSDAIRRCYLHGVAPNEIVASANGPYYGGVYYFQDGRGNTTHLTDESNNVIEHYTYYLSGQPSYFDGNNNSMGGSLVGNRFLFGGAQLVPQTEIYDMRNRFYLPNLGRFMQSDPMGFGGGDANLFRYCGNDPVNWSDPDGLWQVTLFAGRGYAGYVTFGVNSGVFNIQGGIGIGVGILASINLGDQGPHPEGIYFGGLGTVGGGNAYVGGRVTGYWGNDGKWVSGTARVGALSKGVKYDARNNSLTETGPSYTLGRGSFVGLLGASYSNTGASDQQDTNYQPLGNRQIQAWDANGNPISMGTWDENVVASPVSEDASGGGSHGPANSDLSSFGSIWRGDLTSGGYPVGLPAGYDNMGFALGGGGWITQALLDADKEH